jgi:hypothetical protein
VDLPEGIIKKCGGIIGMNVLPKTGLRPRRMCESVRSAAAKDAFEGHDSGATVGPVWQYRAHP